MNLILNVYGCGRKPEYREKLHKQTGRNTTLCGEKAPVTTGIEPNTKISKIKTVKCYIRV